MNSMGWIGVDLDGTIAHYDRWQGITHIGAPVGPMVKRVKEWLSDGVEVRIMTARVSEPDGKTSIAEIAEIIADWCEEHIGVRLEATNKKDFHMIELWDDRAITVIRNTGEVPF